MTQDMQRSELYTEKIMNMILDAINDIIIIHDSEHTIIWMNRAGEKAFGKSVDSVIGLKCYSLFNHTTPCDDCDINHMSNVNMGQPMNFIRRRILPNTGVICDCRSIPYYENGRLELVVQHLVPVRPCDKSE